MFSPAVGRVARSFNALSAAPTSCLARVALNATPPQSDRPTHYRRYSSSKPSTPPSSKKKPTEIEQNTTTKPSGSDRRAKGALEELKDLSTASLGNNIPFVPPTHHLRKEDVNLSAFFGLHRPISIMRPFPNETSVEAFDALFEAPSNNAQTFQRNASVIDQFIGHMNSGIRAQEDQQTDTIEFQEVYHLDATPTEQGIKDFASRLLPFSPPSPPPRIHGSLAAELEAVAYTAQDLSAAINQRTVTEVPLPTHTLTTFREHVARRRYGMLLISVKRQRKLKMKKHKYKKLMKRTRLLRRKLDRT